jgi:type I restriction enzyme S subunit
MEMENNLPKGWANAKLKDLCDLVYGKGLLTKFLTEEGYPVYGANGIIGKYSKYIYKEPQVIISCRGAASGVIHKTIPYSFVTSNSIVLQLNSKAIDLDYFQKSIMSVDRSKIVTGSAQPQITIENLNDLEFPIAPLSEQHRIVAKLDAVMQKVESNKQRLDKIPKLLKRFRQSVLAAAVSGKLTEDWRGKNGIVDDWEEKRIDELFKVKTGITPLRSNESYYKDGTIPWAKTGEVKNRDIFEIEERITQKAIDETGIKIFPVNSILIAMYGEGKTRGSVGRLKIPSTTNQACAVLINEEIDFITNQFVFLFLLSQYEEMRSVAVGGVRPNLNLDKIKSIVLNLPEVEEQKEIVRIIEQLFVFADKIEARYTKAKIMLDKLPQSILAKAFRGELVAQDPNDEPASVLLERIKAEKEKLAVEKKGKKTNKK